MSKVCCMVKVPENSEMDGRAPPVTIAGAFASLKRSVQGIAKWGQSIFFYRSSAGSGRLTVIFCVCMLGPID